MVFSPDFVLLTEWRLPARIEDVADILAEPERLPEWWPEVYLEARPIAPGDADGIGRTVAFRTRGRLPFALSWQGRVIELQPPHRITLEASGDSGWPRDMAAGAAWAARHRSLRVAGRRRAAALAPDRADPKAALRRQPPLGDGARARGAAPRARTARAAAAGAGGVAARG